MTYFEIFGIKEFIHSELTYELKQFNYCEVYYSLA